MGMCAKSFDFVAIASPKLVGDRRPDTIANDPSAESPVNRLLQPNPKMNSARCLHRSLLLAALIHILWRELVSLSTDFISYFYYIDNVTRASVLIFSEFNPG
jgi:hypothetical protein